MKGPWQWSMGGKHTFCLLIFNISENTENSLCMWFIFVCIPMNIHIRIYIHIYVYVYICMYMEKEQYKDREAEIQRQREREELILHFDHSSVFSQNTLHSFFSHIIIFRCVLKEQFIQSVFLLRSLANDHSDTTWLFKPL